MHKESAAIRQPFLPFSVIVLALAMTACATPISYEASQEADVDIGAFSTFRLKPRQVPDGVQPARTEAIRLIEQAIRDALVAKGYRPVEAGEDFVVDYVVYSESVYQQGGHDRFFFDNRIRLESGSEARLANPVQIGTLHVHLLFPDGGRPFFEAIASEVIEQHSLDEAHVRRAVNYMLSGIPKRPAAGARRQQ